METVPRQEEQARTVGQSAKRVEDQRLLTGKGRFVADLEPVANIAHAAILRSTQAHAKIVSIDTSEAEEASDVGDEDTSIDAVGSISPHSSAGRPRKPAIGRTRRPLYDTQSSNRVLRPGRCLGEPVRVLRPADGRDTAPLQPQGLLRREHMG